MEADRQKKIEETTMTTQSPVVLVVDDEAHIRESLEKTLVKEGWHVVQAASGQEGLDQLRQQPINVAVCDLRMPITDGIQFLKAARVMSPETAVIVMTGEERTDMEDLRRAGADHVLIPGEITGERILERLRQGAEGGA